MVDLPQLPSMPASPVSLPLLSQSLSNLGQPPASKAAQVSTISEQKRAQVAAAAEGKKLLLGGVTPLATAMAEGNDRAQSEVAQDLKTLGIGDLAQKYGPEFALESRGLARERLRVMDIQNSSRGEEDKARDALLGVGAGVTSGLGGIAAFGAGLVSDEAGATVAKGVDWAAGKIRGAQSAVLQRQRDQGGVRSELDREDIAQDYEDDKASGQSYPGLRRFGREVLRGFEDLRENPSLAGDLVSEGVGSLLGSAGINGVVVKATAKLVLRQAGITGERATRFLSTRKGQELMKDISQKSMPASIGALEGGGAYVGIQSEIQAMSEAELLEGSEEYVALRQAGRSHEDARNEIANIAGIEGGAIQGLVSAATGTLVSKFEADPLGLGRGNASRSFSESLSRLGENFVKEGIEEGAQGASSGIVSGMAIREHADASRDPFEGAGTETARGLVAGAGMATALRAPEVAATGLLAAGEQAVRGTVAAGAAAGRAITDRARTVEATTEAQAAEEAGIGASAASQAAARAQATLGELRVALDEAPAPSPEVSAESSAPVETPLRERVVSAENISADEANSTPDPIRKLFLGDDTLPGDMSLSRLDAMNAVREELESGTHPKALEDEAALWLFAQAQQIQAVNAEDLSTFDERIQGGIQKLADDAEIILATPKVAELLKRAREITSTDLGPLPEITPETAASPEVRQAVQRMVALAQSNPAGVDPRFVNQLLDQRARGGFGDLREETIRQLKAAAAIVEQVNNADAQKAQIVEDATNVVRAQPGGEKAALKKTTDIVREEILKTGKTKPTGEVGKGQWGLSRHLSQIVTSLNQGRVRDAQGFLNDLRNFGEHMQNKVDAYKRSAERMNEPNNKTTFRTWTGTQWLEADHKEVKPVWFQPKSQNSVILAREATVDAETVTNLYNNLLTIYGGQLAGEALPSISVPAILRVGGKLPAAKKTTTTPAATPTTQSEAKPAPEPKAQPKVEEPAQTEETTDEPLIDKDDIQPDPVAAPLKPAQEKPEAEKQSQTVKLSGDGPYVAKDQRKADDANKFIGRGSNSSSTNRYAKDFGNAANSGRYNNTDRVFISAEGNRSGRIDPDFNEIQRAIDAGSTLITDNKTDRERPYNKGERQVAEYILSKGYRETSPGLWTPAAPQAKSTRETTREDGKQKAEAAADTTSTGAETGTSQPAEAVDEGAANESEAGADQRAGSGEGSADRADAGTVDEAPDFSNLPAKGGVSRFLRAYVIDPTRSLLMREANPADRVLNALKDGDVSVGYIVDPVRARRLSNLIATEGMAIIDKMNARLNHKPKDKQSPFGTGTKRDGDRVDMTPLEAITHQSNKIDFLGVKEGRALNIVDPATGRYDPRLIQTAVLAGIHWVMNSPRKDNLNAEEVAKMFDVKEIQVTPLQMKAAHLGLRANTAAESLARVILEFWGAEINPDAPLSDSLGIAQAVAAEILTTMEGRLTTQHQFKETLLDEEGNNTLKDYVTIELSNPATAEEITHIGPLKSFMADVFLPKSEKPFYFDETPPEVRRAQKGNPQGRLGSDMLAALRKHQEIPFYRNTPFVNLLKSLGQETYAQMMGAVEMDPEITNKIDAMSIEGRNKQLLGSWENTLLHNDKLEGHAEAARKNPDEVATHFDWYVVSNERIHADGFNPQANKTMREAFVATVATLDLTTEDGRDRELFWLTVAQSSGLVKTEKTPRAEAVKAVQELMERYAESINALGEWLESGSLTEAQINTLMAEMGTAGNPKLLHSILAVARFNAAMGTEKAKSFRHSLSLEADGKTDGPINAMLHFTAGEFDQDQLDNMMKGGAFFGPGSMTLNEHTKRDGADLYQTAADRMATYLAEHLRGALQNPTNGAQARAMMVVMNRLLPPKDFQIKGTKDGTGFTVEIGRGTLKNPLTITVYGSGNKGIAGKVANGLMEVIYARLTQQARTGKPALDPQTEEFLRTVTTQRVYQNPETKQFHVSRTVGKDRLARPAPLGNLRDSTKFEFTAENREMLMDNVLRYFVEPMSQAISDLVGNAQGTLKTFQAATQVQSIVMVERFQQVVQEHLDAKRKAGELDGQDFLTQRDYNDILKKLARFGAVIEGVDNDAHHLNLSNRGNAPSQEEFFRNLEGKYSGNAALPQPGEASVSASPMLTISRGDAAMMVNFFASKEIPDSDRLRTTPVFDGLEMPADGIDGISEMINKAVADAWLENPAQDMADSFSDWVRQGADGPVGIFESRSSLTALLRVFPSLDISLEKANKEALNILANKGIHPPQKDAKNSDKEAWNLNVVREESRILRPVIKEYLINLRDVINETAREIQARKNVYKRIAFSVDHMASGENPYMHEGEMPADGETQLDFMNRLYKEELAKLNEGETKKATRPAIEGPSKELQAKIEARGEKLDGTDVYRMSASNVAGMISDQPVARVIAKALPGFTFYFGSSQDLTALRNRMFPEHASAPGIELGQTDPLNGAVFIANASNETILHEMFHTATVKQVQEFYYEADQDPVVKDALGNLEQLMLQFADMDFSSEAENVVIPAQALAVEILEGVTSGKPAGKIKALSEFIAWTLTNQNLAEVLSKSRVRTPSPLKRLAFRALGFVRKLFGLNPSQRMDMFSNIVMNTNAVLAASRISNPGDSFGASSIVLNQAVGQASDPRLEQLMQGFEQKIAAHMRARPAPRGRVLEERAVRALANEALNLVTADGFQLTPQQQSAFKSIQAALASTMEFDSKALIRVQKLFSHVLDQVDLTGFSALMGRYGHQQDPQGRSTLMAIFLALSQVDPGFRQTLAQTTLPKDRNQRWSSVDEALTSMADGLMNTLATTISGEGHGNKTALQSLDRLTQVLARIEADDRTFLEKEAHRLLGTGDRMATGYLSKAGEWLGSLADGETIREGATLRENTRTLLRKGAGVLGALLNEQRGASLADALVSAGNTIEGGQIWTPVLELMNEVFGINDETRGVLGLVNRVKYAVSGMRQDHRETLPKILAAEFTRSLTKNEWSRLHLALGKTDIAALGERFTVAEIRAFLMDARALSGEIAGVEESLRAQAPQAYRDYARKAEELAEFMVSGKIAPGNHNLLRNAEAIARLLGERGARRIQQQGGPAAGTVQSIDELVTLYALRKLDADTKDTLVSLASTEERGMDFLTLYLAHLRKAELNKPGYRGAARLNGYKGHIPSESRDGAHLMVANDSRAGELALLGYTRLGDYKGSGTENGRKGYYYSTVAGRTTYHQGVMQTVQSSVFGVDPRTGYTLTGITAGRVPDQMLGVIKQRVEAQGGSRRAGEALLPVWGADGEVVAYERSMAPERLAALGRNTHLGEMIGAWAGRQAEEALAQGFNRMLVDRVWDRWQEDRNQGRTREYVNLADEDLKDPVHREAWKLVPPEMRDYIRRKFGEDTFMVRRDMVNNTVGYRAASVGDAWTGLSRHDEQVRSAFKDVATAVLGKKAFPWLKQAESFWQAGVSVAKNTIVIRSVIVPLSNLASNVIQLTAVGVGARDIAKGFPEKLVEIDQHLKNLQRKVEINALKAKHQGDPAQLRRLDAELKLLEDASRRMSIWPLIGAGEFSTISEGLTEADAAIGQGKWAQWMQEKMEQIPAQLGTAGRYAVISRDTALFKGMSRAVQYGDFLAKAVLYDHMIKREGKTEDQALNRVTEEFVNYNLLPGRVRSYAESMGLTWFWAYKLKSIKVAHRMIRDNPLRALIASAGGSLLPELPGVSIGSPITDNAVSVAADGRAGYSLGVGMLFNAPGMNPWVNVTS